MKTSWRTFEDVFRLPLQKTSSGRFQHALIKTNIFALVIHLQKTSSRRLQGALLKSNIFVLVMHQTFSRRCQQVLQKHLQDIFKTSSRRFELVFKMSLKRLQDVSKRLPDIFKTFSRDLEDVIKISSRRFANMSFKTFSRSITKLNCLVNTFSIVFNTFLINLWSVYKLCKSDKNFSSFSFSIY